MEVKERRTEREYFRNFSVVWHGWYDGHMMMKPKQNVVRKQQQQRVNSEEKKNIMDWVTVVSAIVAQFYWCKYQW